MPVLKAYNLDLTKDQVQTFITSTMAAGSSTITVKSIVGFAINKYLLLGEWGEEDAEIVTTHTATAPTGTTITLVAACVFAHAVGTKVTLLNYNQVEFSRATTSGGSKTAFTTAPNHTALTPDDKSKYSTYNDATNSTGYWYYRFYNVLTTTYSAYSGEYSYTGTATNTAKYLMQEALNITGMRQYSTSITQEFLLNQLNNWQKEVESLRNWSWETATSTGTIEAGQMAYTLPTDIKHTDNVDDIIQIRIRNYTALAYIDKREYDEKLVDTTYNTLAADVALVDTTITLTDSSDFPTSGTIVIGDDEIDFTGNDTSTNILSGVTGITSTHTSGDTVWLYGSLNQPEYYSIYDGSYYLFPAADPDYDGYSITINYYKLLSELSGEMSVVSIPFYHLAPYYLAWKIETQKGSQGQADYWRQLYENRLARELRQDMPVVFGRFTLTRTKGAG